MNEAPGQRRCWWPTPIAAALVALMCAVAAGVAAGAAGTELTRGPTPVELDRAAAAEVARRWRAWPAGKIFPETVRYAAEQGGEERARRVGISRETRCDRAVDAGLRKALRRSGCLAVLRATYLDALQGIVVTVGVAAFADETGAVAARTALPRTGRPSPGLKALAFPGTVSERFSAAGRQTGLVRQEGPYVVLATAGQVDGRPARAVGEQRPTLFAFTGDIADRVLSRLATPGRPDCRAEEWRC
ncbi:hypothetical protein FHS43_004844 [Streptosporangium becharense]|uniref:Uncharacterized protein n=1 Tax=Streptosporangium becharense TaxID=1816182 RepID=A0A7W9MHS0_9ACTN|nr:hypothetical protein [Streptosporangium becharense]MBB2913540.1 hypothetical protein [Streptosporangium becharense]MBB5821230.1 hypothetical protein [Streptosporangium becharense]